MILTLAILLGSPPAAHALPPDEQARDLGRPQNVLGASPVLGGEDAAPGQWPSTAALLYGGYSACSGVLIAPEWVLTAGHCADTVDEIVLDTTVLDTPGERIAVANFFEHPNSSQTFDVALVQLVQPAQTAPIQVSMDCISDDFAITDAPVTIAGFGAIDTFGQQATSTLQQARTTLRTASCDDEDAGCRALAMPDGEVIAGGEGVDSCLGDSGGPLFLDTPYGDLLLAVTSRAAIPTSRPCGDGGIYVRVDAIRDWIEQVSGSPLPTPDCDSLNRRPALSAPDFEIVAGTSASIQLVLSDLNASDQHRFYIDQQPTLGTAWVNDQGALGYTAMPRWRGQTIVRVSVIDDGDPPLEAVIDVPIYIVQGGVERPGGCATLPLTPLGWWMLFPVCLLRRRP